MEFQADRRQHERRNLAGRAGAGDRAALGELYRHHSRAVRAVLHRHRFADEDDDLLDEIIDGIFSSAAVFRNFRGDNFATLPGYLCAIAMNKLAAHRRQLVRRKSRAIMQPLEPATRGGSSGTSAPTHEPAIIDHGPTGTLANELFAELLAHLDPRDRQIFRMICDDYSHREIGDRIGMKPQTVKTRIHKIRRKLQPVFAELAG